MKRRAILLVVMIMLTLALPLGAAADDPPRPTARHQHRMAGLPVTGPAEVVQFVLEFPPGAATPPHTHPGLVLATVLEGEVTFETGGAITAYKRGETLVELPGEVGVARNVTGGTTRVAVSMVVPQGAAPSAPQPGGPSPAPTAPVTRHLFRTPAAIPPGGYDVVLQVLDFSPGAQTPFHTHPGQVVVTVLEGENTFTYEGKTTVYKVGESFVEQPGVEAQASNAGGTPAAVMATYLLPPGEPLSHPVAPAPPPGGNGGYLPGMPDTGAGGGQGGATLTAGLGLGVLGTGAILACGWIVRRREAARRD